MKQKRISAGLLVLVAVGLLAVPAQGAETITWKAQALWSASELPYRTFVDFCQRVEKLTDGRLKITPYPAGTIVPTFECLDAVRHNILQAMHQWPGYWTGKNPAFAPISDLVGAWRHPWEVDAFYHYRGGLDLLNEIYRPFGVYCVGVTLWGMESMPSKVPIRRIEDFKGLKFRAPQGMAARLLARLGASVVTLPGSEVYSALDKGVIDGTDWGTPSMNQRMGLYQVARYFNFPGFHAMPVGDFTVNQKEWDRLPDDIKQILRTAVRQWAWDMVERVAIDDLRAIGEMKSKGVTPIIWNEQELARARAAAREVWDEWAKKSPMCKTVIDAQKAWLKELGLLSDGGGGSVD